MTRTAPRILWPAAACLLVLGVLAPTFDAPAVRAQQTTGSDWAPFVGELQMWCTRSTGASGPCAGHHNGWAIDIDIPLNGPVYAAGSGAVAWMEDGCAPEGGDGGCNSRAGNYLAVDHGDHYSRYMHLADIAPGLEIGSPITAGQLVGYSGASGTNEGGAHLHYDEIGYPLSTSQRIFFGPMLACHGNTVVRYPDVLGTTDWQQVPWGTTLRNDGYGCLGGAPTPAPSPPPAAPRIDTRPGGAVGLAFGDLNGDGRADLAIGAPGEDVGTRTDGGTSAVVYGAGSGLGSTTKGLRQGKGLEGATEAGDMLGGAIASGDFDCDGVDDLAIGSPGEDIGRVRDAGAVNIAYGARGGLSTRGAILRQGKWLPGTMSAGELTGAALATGDFNGDGCDDLAVGAPGEDVSGLTDAGALLVIHGRSGGFSRRSTTSGPLAQEHGLSGFTEAGDNVGATLAAGDFDCDGIDDLAIGAPSESIDDSNRAGAVNVVHGSAAGLGSRPVTIYQSSGMGGVFEAGDRVGAAMAAGDFNRNGCDDLAVGAPGEDLPGSPDAGAVTVSFGSRSGFANSSVHFQSDGLAGKLEGGDLVGAALAAVDLNCDGYDDLAVGAPGEDIGRNRDAGWVGVIRGGRRGMGRTLVSLSQGKGGLPGANEPGDLTGNALAAGFVDSDRCGDLAIGAPGESIGRRAEAGRVIVVHGAASGTRAPISLSQGSNLPGGAEPGDLLGGPGVWRLLGLSLQ